MKGMIYSLNNDDNGGVNDMNPNNTVLLMYFQKIYSILEIKVNMREKFK